MGHTKVHVPAPESKTPPLRHDVQLVALPAVQVLQDVSQARHAPLDSYLPAGQLLTHDPLSMSGVPLEGQLRQAVEPAPEHSLHVE